MDRRTSITFARISIRHLQGFWLRHKSDRVGRLQFDALNQLVNSTAPDKGVGLQLNIPLRNRAAQGVQLRSELEYRQAQMRLQQIENQVESKCATRSMPSRRIVQASSRPKAAADLRASRSTPNRRNFSSVLRPPLWFCSIRASWQRPNRALVNSMVAYEKSRIELDRSTGQLVDHAGINIEDAARGQVQQLPHAPFIKPRAEDAFGCAFRRPHHHSREPASTPGGLFRVFIQSVRQIIFSTPQILFFLTILYNPARVPRNFSR